MKKKNEINVVEGVSMGPFSRPLRVEEPRLYVVAVYFLPRSEFYVNAPNPFFSHGQDLRKMNKHWKREEKHANSHMHTQPHPLACGVLAASATSPSPPGAAGGPAPIGQATSMLP